MRLRLPATLAATVALTALLISCGDAEGEIAPAPTVASSDSNATQAPTGTPPQTAPSPSSPAGATVTYTDPTYGYSFAYPSSWYLSTPTETGGDLVLQSYDPATAPGIGGPLPKDKLKATIRVQEGVDKPVEQWLAEARNMPGQPPPPAILSTSQVTIGGKGGLVEISEYEGEKLVAYYLVIGGGRLLIVGARPADSTQWPQFELAIATLRFTP